MTTLEIAGRSVAVSNLDKVLYPATGFTKRDLIDYVRASALLAHVRDRPLTLGRFPDGVDGPGWYQVRCRGRPEWMDVARVSDAIDYCVVADEAGLVWAANTGAIEFHPFLWRSSAGERPDVVIFDLDPAPDAPPSSVAALAVELHEMLPDACVKTSGARGLHVYAGTSLDSFDETRRFARTAAERLAEDRPDLATTLSSHGARRGRVLIDWKQNDPHRSTIAAYSLRGLTVPLVSTPITWDEVKRMRDGSRMRFGPREVLDRLDRLGDLFRHFAF